MLHSINKVNWKAVQSRVYEVNPHLANAINEIAQNEQPSFFFLSYSFGESIVKHGVFHFPQIEGKNAKKFANADFPLCLSLDKSIEAFFDFPHVIIPLRVIPAGQLFSTNTLFAESQENTTSRLNFSAGARSIFMLPKIADQVGYNKMRRQLNVADIDPSHQLSDQGPVFAKISRAMRSKWRCNILVFENEWLEGLKAGKWPSLRTAFLEQRYFHSDLYTDKLEQDFLAQILAKAEAPFKSNLYVTDTVRHIANIAQSKALGFAPISNNDETQAPVQDLQKAYLQYYQLKYIPMLMAPCSLSARNSVYYSFLYPTEPALSPQHNFRNTLEDQRNIKRSLEALQNELLKDQSQQQSLVAQTQFDFFHFEADPAHTILPLCKLPEFDPVFGDFRAASHLPFAENAPFLRACVRIQKRSVMR